LCREVGISNVTLVTGTITNAREAGAAIENRAVERLYLRTYKFNLENLQKKTGLTGTSVSREIREFILNAGVDLQQPGRSYFYHESHGGELLVRAKLDELDLLETAVKALNTGTSHEIQSVTNASGSVNERTITG